MSSTVKHLAHKTLFWKLVLLKFIFEQTKNWESKISEYAPVKKMKMVQKINDFCNFVVEFGPLLPKSVQMTKFNCL